MVCSDKNTVPNELDTIDHFRAVVLKVRILVRND